MISDPSLVYLIRPEIDKNDVFADVQVVFLTSIYHIRRLLPSAYARSLLDSYLSVTLLFIVRIFLRIFILTFQTCTTTQRVAAAITLSHDAVNTVIKFPLLAMLGLTLL